jgi:hypothetical protein
MNPESTKDRREDALRTILASQLARYPRMEIADLYKLLHQAVFGSEHAVTDPERARALLRADLAALTGLTDPSAPPIGPEEPLLDPISADHELVRVHLRAHRKAGLDPKRLADAFLRTAAERRGSPGEMRTAWHSASEFIAETDGRFSDAELADYFAVRAAERFPAVRHSETYRRIYAPSYRVVRAAHFEGEAGPRRST